MKQALTEPLSSFTSEVNGANVIVKNAIKITRNVIYTQHCYLTISNHLRPNSRLDLISEEAE